MVCSSFTVFQRNSCRSCHLSCVDGRLSCQHIHCLFLSDCLLSWTLDDVQLIWSTSFLKRRSQSTQMHIKTRFKQWELAPCDKNIYLLYRMGSIEVFLTKVTQHIVYSYHIIMEHPATTFLFNAARKNGAQDWMSHTGRAGHTSAACRQCTRSQRHGLFKPKCQLSFFLSQHKKMRLPCLPCSECASASGPCYLWTNKQKDWNKKTTK